MSIEEQSATGDTEFAQDTTPADRTYTQRDVDDMMARMKSSLTKKLSSRYEDLGDPDELRAIVEQHKKREHDNAMRRGEFDKIMAELASKKDAEIAKRDDIIREFKIEQPLINLAAQYKSVNPEQVKALLRAGVRLNEDGEVEVIDSKTQQVKYRNDGKPYDVESYVREFLDLNPHFVAASPATTNTQTNVGKINANTFDLKKLDLTRADHREQYKQAKKAGLI